jgi:hypothetical protein
MEQRLNNGFGQLYDIRRRARRQDSAVEPFNCHITKIVIGHKLGLSTQIEGKGGINQVLEWLWDTMKDKKEHGRMVAGHRYWTVSWDRSSKVHSLDMDIKDSVRASCRLIKKFGYTTIMVSDL